MKIYVESRGDSPDFDYCWKPEVPSYMSNISGLIESESPSVVIARFDRQLMLLVTGLESQDKKDFRDRPIRHSIAWVCNDNPYAESQIRAIAVEALQGLLSSKVDKYINFDSESGFKASLPQDISELVSMAEIEQRGLPQLEVSCKIGKNSQDLRDDLAYKLEKYSLPKRHELLVVVTGNKSQKSLENAGIWRSLSNLVKSENWRDLSRSEAENSNSNFGVAIAIIAVIAIAACILIMILHSPSPEVAPTPTPTLSLVNQAIEKRSSSNALEKDLTSLWNSMSY